MTILYLAGPMRGIKNWNFDRFLEVAGKLRDVGYIVLNPAEADLDNGFEPWGMTGFEDITEGFVSRRELLRTDINWIADMANGVAVLEGWENSSGARAEVAFGDAIEIPCHLWDWWVENA